MSGTQRFGVKGFADASPWLLALLQALALWGLHESLNAGSWPATEPVWLGALYPFVLWVPLTVLLLWSHWRERVLWLTAGALGLFLLWSGSHILDGIAGPVTSDKLEEDAIAGFVLPWMVAWLIAVPLLRARLEAGRWRAPYPVLFRGAARSYLTLAETALFTGIFWGLLALWAGLFETLGIDFFKTLFADARFVYPATTLAVTVALRIIGNSDRLVDGVLDQLLGLLKWLAPLAGLIVVLFTVALLPKLPALLASGEKILDSGILLALVALTLLLLNAAYRDGEHEPEYGRLIRQALRVVSPLLVIVASTALVSMIIRTADLGLTPARFWGLVTATFALLFAIGYAIAAVRHGPWFGELRRVNFVLAILLLATLIISLTPIGNPVRWSVANQLSRAVAAATESDREGALRFLRFDAGAQGRQVLDALVQGRIAAVDPVLRDEAARIAALSSKHMPPRADPAATPARYAAWRDTLRVLPADRTVPADLESLLRTEFWVAAATLDPGGNAPAPRLVFIDLDADGREDALLISGTRRGEPLIVRDYRVFIRTDEVWRQASAGTLAR